MKNIYESRFGLVAAFLLIILSNCSYFPVRPTPEEKQLLTQAISELGPEYSQARLVTGELIVRVKNIDLLQGDSHLKSNLKHNIPEQESPSLRIWSSAVRNYPTQQLISSSFEGIKPDTVFIDNEYDNQILFWNLTQQLRQKTPVILARKFTYITFDYRPVVDVEAERRNWHTIPRAILEKYTRSERFLEQDAALVDTVYSILENTADPLSQALVIYNWVQSSMTYVYPPQERGVRNACETLEGDCGQYSALFMTMARIAGIPARQQSGFNFYPDNTGAHVWSEIYLPIKGWVPVDATREDGFLHLDNRRLITSIGLNIPLSYAPDWSSFSNSEVEAGKTDFMQHYTLVKSGFTADFSTVRRVVRSVELK